MAEKTGLFRRKKPPKKLDISAPLGDLQRIVHIAPEQYTPNHADNTLAAEDDGALGPPPCRGKVKDGTDSTRSMSSENVTIVDQTAVNNLTKEIQDLVISAVGVINKAEEIKAQLEKIMTNDHALPNLLDKDPNRNKISEDVFVGDGEEYGDRCLYENTVEGVTAREKQALSAKPVRPDLCENTINGVSARDKQTSVEGAVASSKQDIPHIATGVHTDNMTSDGNQSTNSNVVCGKSSGGELNQQKSKDKPNKCADEEEDDETEAEEDDDGDDDSEPSEMAQIENSILNPIYLMETSHKKEIQKTDHYPKKETMKQRQPTVPLNAAGPFIKKPLANLYAKAENRECLSDALRAHVVDIVENVVFRESELPDELTAESCITEDECESIRQITNRRGQVRALLCAIRGKDYNILVRFLEKIETTNRLIAEMVTATFEEYRKRYHRSTHCAKCKLMERINVKYVCDGLLAVDAIDDGVYNEIVFDTKPTGAQRELWNRVIDSINRLELKHRCMAYDFVNTEISKKHYKYVSDHLRKAVANGRQLHCQCRIHPNPRGSDPVDYFSPRSSSEVSRHSSNTDLKEIFSDPEQAVKSPEMDRKGHDMRNVSFNEEDKLETIKEQSEKSSGVKESKPKALPRVSLSKKPQTKEENNPYEYLKVSYA